MNEQKNDVTVDCLTEDQREELLELLQSVQEELQRMRSELHAVLPSRPKGKQVKVDISDGAFLSILTSSVEAYPSSYMGNGNLRTDEGEVMGFLYGHVEEDETSCTYHVIGTSVVHSYLSQGESFCSVSVEVINKVRNIAGAIPGIECIGRFHSHPYPYSEFKTGLCSRWSGTDFEDTMASITEYSAPPLELIFALSYLNKAKKKAPVFKPSWIVSYCKRFKFVLRAFAVNAEYMSLDDVDALHCALAKRIRNA